MKGKDISGAVYGKLTVIKKLEKKHNSSYLYEVLCECGNIVEKTPNQLGDMKSCGCQQYNKAPKDITGKHLNSLTALRSTGVKSNNGDFIWEFICDCGGTCTTTIGSFNSGKTTSCGCAVIKSAKNRDTYHGMSATTEYKTWLKMKERCSNPNDVEYPFYGAVGINYCEEWKDFRVFIKDVGLKPNKSFTLDRIDLALNYNKDNCRWASKYVQNRNKKGQKGTSSSYKGVQYEESSGKWIATISVGKYKSKKIGRYLVEEHAACAYNVASTLIFGEDSTFTYLNNVSVDKSVVNMDCKFFKYWVDQMKIEYLDKYQLDISIN